MKYSLVYTFFRSLELAHLERSMFSLSKQFALPDDLILFENNTGFGEEKIKEVVALYFDLSQWKFHFNKHGDPRKGASWCHNHAISLAENEVFILARADIIYDFVCCAALINAYKSIDSPLRFTSCYVKHMDFYDKSNTFEKADHAADLEPLRWREDVQRLSATLGRNFTETHLDAASFCTSKTAMKSAGWYDEDLTSWGMWQQSLQMDMRERGVEFYVIPEILQYHMQHGADRDTLVATSEFANSPRRKGIRNNFIA